MADDKIFDEEFDAILEDVLRREARTLEMLGSPEFHEYRETGIWRRPKSKAEE